MVAVSDIRVNRILFSFIILIMFASLAGGLLLLYTSVNTKSVVVAVNHTRRLATVRTRGPRVRPPL